LPVSLGYKLSALFSSQPRKVSVPCRASGTRFNPSRRLRSRVRTAAGTS
jgi:hypothetical protein